MKKRSYLLMILGVILVLTYASLVGIEKAFSFPTALLSLDGAAEIVVPDWNQISFSQFPSIVSSGSAQINGITRIWQKGQTPEQYITLGDIQELSPHLATLDYLSTYTGLNLDSVGLNQFPLAGQQNLGHLVDIVPDLGSSYVSDILPISKLINSKCQSGLQSGTINQALRSCGELLNLPVNIIDLSPYTLDSIPNLDVVPLENFQNWQNQYLAEIPGMSNLSLASFPNPVTATGNSVARIDAVWSSAEARRIRSVSGSDLVGFEVPCTDGNCAYIELDDLEGVGREIRGDFEGKSWIWGQQEVPGGHGCLAVVNGGVEPTGRHPWGSSFKVVVENPDEATDTVETALYFRWCNQCGCTPYFLGPVPFITYRVNSLIFLGSSLQETKELAGFPVNLVNKNQEEGSFRNLPLKIEAKKLTAVLSNDGNHDQISPYFHCRQGKGRLLGKYQLPSFDSEVSQIIKDNKGENWLKKIESGADIAQEDLFTYFPPLAQDNLVEKRISSQLIFLIQETDPQTNKPFTSERLIERTAQIYGFGAGVKVSSPMENPWGKNIVDYGKNVLLKYKSN